ncbi:similar to Saccharomyces cerevisiae YIR008C PRI1 Subunit of DNA primase, which is required for DNA synthesis and double-strand break repair [Maudiozyma barnettii]|uniref:DNA primase n=1 Tax=Maudiozyma barnettii TaxID=61262 RepID=A0A8H2VIV3_9SACH|nr:DNA primase subunit PRI1 [Kazachstania barnettii]CAB4256444.1 similar to Saccharomyces cerevisiae YIR008C PRI1 Subunit of DNA primase, which is required for DNA synthesis and double-strand break repair [Kazachstania barnettii]CAD1785053.1 similar to Saccharomyces cerevisiae YIR008C PRI1 Subunit of DNA primase, which is required for DNA synthesis and double-strand break repair [Kazachstania barnettii]
MATTNGTPSGPSSSDMEYYYRKLYPFTDIYHWLNHSMTTSKDMTHREFAMAFRSGAYKRYNSYTSIQEFKQQIERANPDRFEIGAIYNKPPKERDTILKSEMKALEKELVFDIDMDDYDSYRTCCTGAMVCSRCWKFITLAMEVMNITLSEDFGFKDFVWVFSGRRGAHCWISDKRARQMGDLQRRNILDYVNVVRDRSNEKRLSLMRPYHPLLVRSLDLLKPHFSDIILEEQDPWADDANAFATLLTALHDKLLMDACRKYWTENPGRSSKQKWSDIDVLASSEVKANKRHDYLLKLKECKEDIILQTLYPKLDVEVTKQTIHLLKAPFCIHPATGNVCVPIIDGFEPSQAPKLIGLQEEMTEHNDNVKFTSLQKFLDYFEKYVNQVIENNLDSGTKREYEELLK